MKRKGDNGIVGVIGGSLYYTGAPYFVAASSLRNGVDLAFVVTTPSASTPIKSYLPDLIVLPVLYEDVPHVEKLFKRFTVIVFGSGLGRESLFKARLVLENALSSEAPLVVDGDGISLFMEYLSACPSKHFSGEKRKGKLDCLFCSREKSGYATYVTPNHNERKRIIRTTKRDLVELTSLVGIAVIVKGRHDVLYYAGERHVSRYKGAPRRCGGLGDLFCGVIASRLTRYKEVERVFYSSCRRMRRINRRAYAMFGESMLASDLLQPKVYSRKD